MNPEGEGARGCRRAGFRRFCPSLVQADSLTRKKRHHDLIGERSKHREPKQGTYNFSLDSHRFGYSHNRLHLQSV